MLGKVDNPYIGGGAGALDGGSSIEQTVSTHLDSQNPTANDMEFP